MPIVSGASGGGSGALTLVTSQTLGADTASFDLTGLPGTYNDLVIVLKLRGAQVATGVQLALTLNNDGGANYTYVRVDQSASATTPGGTTGTSALLTDNVPAASATAAHFFQGQITLYGYASTVWHKQGFLVGSANISASLLNTASFQWANTAAINRVTLTPSAGNWLAGSGVFVYGIS